MDDKGKTFTATVLGIDDYGFLKVQKNAKEDPISLHPDGNSFDIFRGLIIPKK